MMGVMEEATTEKSYAYGKRPLWQWVLLYVVIGAILYGLVYYFVLGKKDGYTTSQNGQYQYPTTTQQVTTQPTTQSASPSPSISATQVTVSGTEFAFTPSTITVKVGQPVQITFKNNGTYPHNLTLADLQAGTKTIQPGAQDTITFTPTKTGSFTYVCTVPGHADRGMKGTLIVQ